MQKPVFKSKMMVVGAFFSILLLSLIVWWGCSQEPQNITAPNSESQAVGSLSKAAGDLDRAMAIQDRHTEALLAIRDVVGTATTQLADGRYAVKILTKTAGIERSLPQVLEDVPVVIEATGEINAFSHLVRMGSSTSNVNQCAAGTFGCVATKISTGGKRFLSNNHVFARSNAAAIGEDIVSPGRLDATPQCSIPERVADLSQFVTIVFSSTASNKVDCAIATIRSTTNYTTATRCGYTPSSTTVNATLGMSVKKCGRTTGLTTGSVTGVNVTVLVNYGSPGTARFIDQIQFTDISNPGDSGSLIVTNNSSANPVALLFAGSSTTTFGNKIQNVTSALGIRIN